MKIVCPISQCRTENNPQDGECRTCRTPLAAYARFQVFQAQLYNQALSAARSGDLQRARELFASVIAWYPHDVQARNGLAMACFQMGDRDNARLHWDMVLSRRPQDETALKGMALLEQFKASVRDEKDSKGLAAPARAKKSARQAGHRPKTKKRKKKRSSRR